MVNYESFLPHYHGHFNVCDAITYQALNAHCVVGPDKTLYLRVIITPGTLLEGLV